MDKKSDQIDNIINHSNSVLNNDESIKLTIYNQDQINKLDPRKFSGIKPENVMNLRILTKDITVWKNPDGTIHSNKKIYIPKTKNINNKRKEGSFRGVFASKAAYEKELLKAYDIDEVKEKKLLYDIYNKMEKEYTNWIDTESLSQTNTLVSDKYVGNIDIYNKYVINKDIYKELVASNPGVVGWILADDYIPIGKYNHIGQVINIVKKMSKERGLDSHWKHTAKMPSKTIFSILTDIEHPAGLIKASGETRIIPDDVIKYLLKNKINIRSYMDLKTAEKLYKLMLTTNIENIQNDFNDILDYARYLSSTGRLITSNTYDNLRRASQNWHNNLILEAYRGRLDKELEKNNGWIESWNPIVGERSYTIDNTDIKVVPLTNPIELVNEGITMSHCVGLGDYADSCAKGLSRVYSILEDGVNTATVEIVPYGNKWAVRQVTTKHSHPAGSNAIQASEKLVEDFQKAIRDGAKHKTQYIHYQTGKVSPSIPNDTKMNRFIPKPMMPRLCPNVSDYNFGGRKIRRPFRLIPKLPGRRR